MNELPSDQRIPALITKLTVEEDGTSVWNWLVKAMIAGTLSPGHINSEITPPTATNEPEWLLVQRFENMEKLSDWHESKSMNSLASELSQKIRIDQQRVEHYAPPANVATAILTHIKPGKEAEYRDWVSRIHVAQINASGYRGTFLQPAPSGSKSPWITILRFDSAESLDRWVGSDVRKELLAEAEEFVRFDLVALTSEFPGWFPTDPSTGKTPPRYKTSMLVLMTLYPLLTILKLILPPLVAPLGPALGTFCSITISVSITGLIVMPQLIKVFKFWLYPSGHDPKGDERKGFIAIICIYILMIVASQILVPATK